MQIENQVFYLQLYSMLSFSSLIAQKYKKY